MQMSTKTNAKALTTESEPVYHQCMETMSFPVPGIGEITLIEECAAHVVAYGLINPLMRIVTFMSADHVVCGYLEVTDETLDLREITESMGVIVAS